MESPAYIDPTTNSRLKLASLAVLGTLFVAAVKAYWPALMGHITSLPFCEQLPWYQGMLLWACSLCPFAVLVLIRHARKILACGQVPPPGTLVFFRTPIRRGRTALLHAYASIAVAGASVIVAIVLAARAWPVLSPMFISVARCKSAGA